MWQETTKHERNRRIFESELEDFLPRRILDFHVHVFNEGVAPPGEPFSSGGIDLMKYDLEDLRQDLDEIYPGRETVALCFGIPDVRFDYRRNNDYLAQACDQERFFALRLLDPTQDEPETLREELSSGAFLGVKPYPVYPRFERESEVEIKDMLPDWSMESVDDLGQLVMLHIPRPGRLADPVNQEQLVRLCTRFPQAKIVLAHLGRAYYLKNIIGNLENLKDLPNLYYDLTMLNHWEVMEYGFSVLRPDRLLYGTDVPIALAPGKSVEINHQYTYVTPKPWALSISDDHQKLEFTSFLYEELRAIRKAVERLRLDRGFVEGLFYDNGMRLIREVQSVSAPAALANEPHLKLV